MAASVAFVPTRAAGLDDSGYLTCSAVTISSTQMPPATT